MNDVLMVDNPNDVELQDLRDTDGDLMTGITINCQAKELDGTPVTGATNPFELTEQEAGHFKGTLGEAAVLLENEYYILHITSTTTPGKELDIQHLCVAQIRRDA
jgi:hypothetical protein